MNDQNNKKDVPLEYLNAIDMAKYELSISPYSYINIIVYLTVNGISEKAAIYAADNCGADWNEEALKTAKIILKCTPQAKDILYILLVSTNFDQEEIKYALSKIDDISEE